MKTIIFNNRKFTMTGGKKYHYNSRLRKHLHQAVWEQHYGEIPFGFHIHHKDHDTLNNNIENLELISISDHMRYHANNTSSETKKKQKDNLDKIRHLTKEWHSSEEGKRWHTEHYEKMKSKLYIEIDLVCKQCGKTYKTTKRDSKFCSNNCKSKNRRLSGVDDEIRSCECCGKKFTVNKYYEKRFCGKKCISLNYKKHSKDSPTLQE